MLLPAESTSERTAIQYTVWLLLITLSVQRVWLPFSNLAWGMSRVRVYVCGVFLCMRESLCATFLPIILAVMHQHLSIRRLR